MRNTEKWDGIFTILFNLKSIFTEILPFQEKGMSSFYTLYTTSIYKTLFTVSKPSLLVQRKIFPQHAVALYDYWKVKKLNFSSV